MNLFKPVSWGLYKVYKDIKNYLDFVKTIKKEKANRDSKFNNWKLKTSYFYSIYFTYDLDETEENLPDNIKRLRIVESLAPLHIYLDEELGFAECLVPEINQFFNDKDEPTLTYLVMYRFAFNKLSINWLIKWFALVSLASALVALWGTDIAKFLSTLL
jgi:hypothetical protein